MRACSAVEVRLLQFISSRKITDVALRFARSCPTFEIVYGDGSHGEFADHALLEQMAQAFDCTKDDIVKALPPLETIFVGGGPGALLRRSDSTPLPASAPPLSIR